MNEKKFYTCKYDRAFKEVFMNENNKDILEKLLESILKVKIEEIKYLNLERNVDNVNVKRKHLDLYLETDIGKIQVEVNSENKKYINTRNFSYICDIYSHHTKVGKEYDEKTLIIQINFSYGLKYSELIRKYMVQDKEENRYVNNLIIYEINMDKYMDVWYNRDEKEIEENKYIMMLNLQPKELKNLSKKDRMVLKYMSEIERVNEEVEFREYMSAEEDNEKIENSLRTEAIEEGLKEGAKEKSISIAQSLLKRGMDKYMVSDITKLDIHKIEELAKDIEPDEYREYMSAEEDNRKIENSIRDEYIGKGIKEGLKEVAQSLLKRGMDKYMVSDITKLDIHKIEELAKDIEPDEYREYMSAEEDNRKIENSIRDEYIGKGRKEGLKEGAKENSISIAKSLLKNNIDINIISESTGLSIKEIESLKNKDQ